MRPCRTCARGLLCRPEYTPDEDGVKREIGAVPRVGAGPDGAQPSRPHDGGGISLVRSSAVDYLRSPRTRRSGAYEHGRPSVEQRVVLSRLVGSGFRGGARRPRSRPGRRPEAPAPRPGTRGRHRRDRPAALPPPPRVRAPAGGEGCGSCRRITKPATCHTCSDIRYPSGISRSASRSITGRGAEGRRKVVGIDASPRRVGLIGRDLQNYAVR